MESVLIGGKKHSTTFIKFVRDPSDSASDISQLYMVGDELISATGVFESLSTVKGSDIDVAIDTSLKEFVVEAAGTSVTGKFSDVHGFDHGSGYGLMGRGVCRSATGAEAGMICAAQYASKYDTTGTGSDSVLVEQ